TPAVSVIIPMYNVEKYISETLDSILAQTFQDFEVIVVDDCSPDNSYATVESCLEKFNGRLTLAKMEQNSGAPGSPRNKGIELSRGEYVYFLDSDDTITPTALEEMYSLAKKFDADVVQCEKFYNVHQSIWNDAERRKSLKPTSYLTGERVLFPKPTLLDADLEKRLSLFWHRRLVWNVCFQLIRREFIMNNEIRFCDIFAEDMLFTLCEASCAKKYLVVPNVIYFYRRHASSTTRTGMDVQKLFHRNVKSLTLGMRYFDNFLNKNEFFLQRVDLKYVLFDIFVWQLTKSLLSIYEKVPKYEIDGFVRKEFAGDNVALMSYIFNMMNSFRYQLIQRQKELSAVKEQLKVMKGATP
ncbi:MAG: glycosyltransferase, partial [Selenomonadaceae bacterium]|nr:glycosyltransferase [Selenomonadaceae bacterium]